MKKSYIKPIAKEVVIDATEILAGSITGGNLGKSGDDAEAKVFYDDEEWD